MLWLLNLEKLTMEVRILLSISRVSSASLLTIVDTHKSRKPNPALYVLKIFMKKEY